MYFTDVDTSSLLYYASRIDTNEVFSTPLRDTSVVDFGHVAGPSMIENQLFLASSPFQAIDNILIFSGNPVNPSLVRDHNLQQVPKTISLKQNYPNPFNPSTKISYTLSKGARIRLDVYDITGKKVTSLVNEKQNANSYEVTFFAENLNSGIYFYTLRVNNFIMATKKMICRK